MRLNFGTFNHRPIWIENEYYYTTEIKTTQISTLVNLKYKFVFRSKENSTGSYTQDMAVILPTNWSYKSPDFEWFIVYNTDGLSYIIYFFKNNALKAEFLLKM